MLSRILDFILYSNIWIGASAAALYLYTKYLFTEIIFFDLVGLFVFLTCIWLYSLHRYIGLGKVNSEDLENRFYKIRLLQKPIIYLAITAFVVSILLVFSLSWKQVLVLSVPGILSLLYVLPVLKYNQRLRDINYIKIFVIALVWAGLTVLLPLVACQDCMSYNFQSLIFVERFVFIFAITLPFDIRDLEVDKRNKVKTISALIGKQGTWLLSFLLLSISSFIFYFLFRQEQIGTSILLIHLTTNILTLICIWIAFWQQHDWYYTGLLDGTMFLPLIFLCLYFWV